MNEKELIPKIHSSMYHQIQKNGFATPIQVLMDIGVLSKEDCERWRLGKVDYLERVCKVNLSKLSAIMREIRSYAGKNNLKASWTFYKQFGQKNLTHANKLRFSKSGSEDIEKAYATHYIGTKKPATLNE